MAAATAEDGAQDMSFQNISLGGKATVVTGVFKMGPAGVGWRGKNGQTTKIVAGDVSNALWTRIGLPYQLKLEAKNGASFKFDGFRETDLAAVKKYIVDSYKVGWTEDAVSHRGWNWGQVEVENSTLRFSVDEQPSFELPLNEATSANMTKTEVSISFNPSGEMIEDGDALAEIKFFVPNTRGDEAPVPAKDHIVSADGEDDEIPEYNEELLVTPAEALANKIMDKIEVLPANAQPIVVFERTSMSTPRGQIDLQLHPNFFFLAGKNFRIDYDHIVRIFLLPQLRDDLSSFVISVDPPIRQGSTSYPLIVFAIPNKEVEVTLNQDGIPEKSRALTLGGSVAGPLDQVIAQCLGTLADKKVTVPGATGFKTSNEEPCVACKYKQGDGMLYPLENSFLCVAPKSPIHIPFTDLQSVGFELTSQSVTLSVILKTGAQHNFGFIPASQHAALYNFCKAKGLRTEGDAPMSEDAASPATGESAGRSKRSSAVASRNATRRQIQRGRVDEDEEDEEDDEFHAGEEEDDEDDDEAAGSEDGGEEEEDLPPSKPKKEKRRPHADENEDAEPHTKKPKTEDD